MLCFPFARFSTTARNIKHIQRLILKLSLCSQQVTPWNPLDLKGQNLPWLYTFGHCCTTPEGEMVSRQVSKSGIGFLPGWGNRFYEGFVTADCSPWDFGSKRQSPGLQGVWGCQCLLFPHGSMALQGQEGYHQH